MLSANEKKVLRLLMSSLNASYSINQIAKECKLSPNGAFKILKKFEKEGVLRAVNIANIRAYKINFDNYQQPVIFKFHCFFPKITNSE